MTKRGTRSTGGKIRKMLHRHFTSKAKVTGENGRGRSRRGGEGPNSMHRCHVEPLHVTRTVKHRDKRESVLQLNMVPLDSLHESKEKDRERRRIQTVNSHAPRKTIPRPSRILFLLFIYLFRGAFCAECYAQCCSFVLGKEIPGWRDSLNVGVRNLINKMVGVEW